MSNEVETIKVQIVPGKRVFHPDTKQPLGDEPVLVEKSSYWYRRMLDGSVVLVDDVASKPAKASDTQNPKGDK